MRLHKTKNIYFYILSLKLNQVLLFFTFAKHTAVIQNLVILYRPIRTKLSWDASKHLAHRKFEFLSQWSKVILSHHYKCADSGGHRNINTVSMQSVTHRYMASFVCSNKLLL